MGSFSKIVKTISQGTNLEELGSMEDGCSDVLDSIDLGILKLKKAVGSVSVKSVIFLVQCRHHATTAFVR